MLNTFALQKQASQKKNDNKLANWVATSATIDVCLSVADDGKLEVPVCPSHQPQETKQNEIKRGWQV